MLIDSKQDERKEIGGFNQEVKGVFIFITFQAMLGREEKHFVGKIVWKKKLIASADI